MLRAASPAIASASSKLGDKLIGQMQHLPRDWTEGEIKLIGKVLTTTDGMPHSDIAIQYAAQLAAKYGAPLTICVVNIAHGGPRGPMIQHWSDQEIAGIFDHAASIARENGVAEPKQVSLVSREAAAGIVAYAEDNGYDQIVVGTGNKRGLSRLMIGSVAADVVARAHVTVTVAR